MTPTHTMVDAFEESARLASKLAVRCRDAGLVGNADLLHAFAVWAFDQARGLRTGRVQPRPDVAAALANVTVTVTVTASDEPVPLVVDAG